MTYEDEFLASKGIASLKPLGLSNDTTAELASTISRINATGMVCRADVAPYIDQFPLTVGLEDFDEEPTGRNVQIATESMAAFLKIGLAIAVVGALGYVVFNLIASRRKCEKIKTEDAHRAYLFSLVNDARGLISTSPAWLNQGMVGADGLNLKNAIARHLQDGPGVNLALEKEGLRLFCRTHYGSVPAFTSRACLDQYAEILSQTKALSGVRSILSNAGQNIQSGRAAEVIGSLKALESKYSVFRFSDALTVVFGNILPKVSQSNSEPDGIVLLKIVDALESYYETTEESSTSVSSFIEKNVVELGTGYPAFPVSYSEVSGDIQRSITAVKDASSECEKLKAESKNYRLSTEVEQQAGETIENINNITKAASRLFDIAALEVNSAFLHAKWMAQVHVKILDLAEDILKQNNESPQASKMAAAKKELEKAIKKSL